MEGDHVQNAVEMLFILRNASRLQSLCDFLCPKDHVLSTESVLIKSDQQLLSLNSLYRNCVNETHRCSKNSLQTSKDERAGSIHDIKISLQTRRRSQHNLSRPLTAPPGGKWEKLALFGTMTSWTKRAIVRKAHVHLFLWANTAKLVKYLYYPLLSQIL